MNTVQMYVRVSHDLCIIRRMVVEDVPAPLRRGRKGSRRRSSSSSSSPFCGCCEDRRWIWKEVVVENFNFSAKILLQGLLNLFIYFVSVRDPKLESVQLQFVGGVL
jgi:hypothetical protein